MNGLQNLKKNEIYNSNKDCFNINNNDSKSNINNYLNNYINHINNKKDILINDNKNDEKYNTINSNNQNVILIKKLKKKFYNNSNLYVDKNISSNNEEIKGNQSLIEKSNIYDNNINKEE